MTDIQARIDRVMKVGQYAWCPGDKNIHWHIGHIQALTDMHPEFQASIVHIQRCVEELSDALSIIKEQQAQLSAKDALIAELQKENELAKEIIKSNANHFETLKRI